MIPLRTLLPLLLALPACRDAPHASAQPPAPATVTAPPAQQPPRPQAEPGDTAPETFEGTAGAVENKLPQVLTTVLRTVRVGRHEAFDRVVFEFSGNALPGYHVAYVDRPVHRCGSGDVVEMAGQGWLEIRMSPAQAHDPQGRATVGSVERRPGLPVLVELGQTCDFEGVVSWVLGVAAPNRYRVLELADPPRIVVDVRH